APVASPSNRPGFFRSARATRAAAFWLISSWSRAIWMCTSRTWGGRQPPGVSATGSGRRIRSVGRWQRSELGHDGLAQRLLQPRAFLGRQGAHAAGEEGEHLDVLAHGEQLAPGPDPLVAADA